MTHILHRPLFLIKIRLIILKRSRLPKWEEKVATVGGIIAKMGRL